MPLESLLERIADSLDAINAHLAAKAGAQTIPKPLPLVESRPAPAVRYKTAAERKALAEKDNVPVQVKYEELRLAVLKLAEQKGHEVAAAVLAQFEVKSARDLSLGQYADCLKAVNAELLS